MIRAARKLKKLWPRKKKRKRPFQDSFYYLPPPPPLLPPPQHFHCCSCSNHSLPPPPEVQPSAPPLPRWLEADQTNFTPEFEYQKEDRFSGGEIVVETNQPPVLSYQQYTVSNPVYGVPVAVRERSGGFFGFFVKFGANLIRCFCPCFRVR